MKRGTLWGFEQVSWMKRFLLAFIIDMDTLARSMGMKMTSWQRLGLSHPLRCSGESFLFGVFHQVPTPPLTPQNGKSDSKLLVKTQPKIFCYLDFSEERVSACLFLPDIRIFLMLFFPPGAIPVSLWCHRQHLSCPEWTSEENQQPRQNWIS